MRFLFSEAEKLWYATKTYFEPETECNNFYFNAVSAFLTAHLASKKFGISSSRTGL